PEDTRQMLEPQTLMSARPSATLMLQRALLERYGPPTVVIDRNDQVVYFHGATGPFLQYPAGEPTRDLLQLVRPSLRLAVRTALRGATRENRPVQGQAVIGESPDPSRTVEVSAEPVVQGKSPEYFMVSFRFLPAAGPEQVAAAAHPISTDRSNFPAEEAGG